MDKYEGLQKVTDWIKNSSSEEFMETFNKLNDNEYSGPTLGDFLSSDDIKDIKDFFEAKESEAEEYITEEEYEQWRKDNQDNEYSEGIDNVHNSKETE